MRDEYSIRRLLSLLALMIFLGAVIAAAVTMGAASTPPTGDNDAGPHGVGPVLLAATVWTAGTLAICRRPHRRRRPT